MPIPLSETIISCLPPSLTIILISVAFASIAFSISSFIINAGLSITSPAAIWLIKKSGSVLISIVFYLINNFLSSVIFIDGEGLERRDFSLDFLILKVSFSESK